MVIVCHETKQTKVSVSKTVDHVDLFDSFTLTGTFSPLPLSPLIV